MSRLDDHKLARSHGELWKFIKFILIGILGAAPEIVAQMVLIEAFKGITWLPKSMIFDLIANNVPPKEGYPLAALVYASILSTFIGQAIAFVLNRKATFHADSNVTLSTFLALLVAALLIVSNGALTPALTGLVGIIPVVSRSKFWVNLLGKLLSMGVPMVWVYPANRFIVHRVRKPQQEKAEEA